MSVEVKGSDGAVVTLSQRLIKGSDLETDPTLLTLDDIPMPQGVTNNSNVAYSDFSAFVTDIPNNNDFRGPDGPQGPAIDSVSLTQSVDLSTVQMSFTYVKDGQTYTINSNPSFTLPTGPTGQQGNSLQSLTHDSQNNTLTFSFTDSVAIPDLTVNLPQGDDGPQGRGISSITKNGDVMTVSYSDGSVSTFSGITGPAGTASTVTVDSTNTLSAGSSASVTETPTSTSQNRELIFNIPTGAQGPQGNDGKEISSIALTDNPSDSTQYLLTVTYDDSTTNSVVFDKPADGVDGNTGATGQGFTGGYYNSSTGTVTFTSNDGLGFITQDLRGTDGKEISTAVLGTDPDNSANYRLTFTYNDSTTNHVNFAKPIDGVDGVNGNGITSVSLGTDPNNSSNYQLTFTFDDNSTNTATFAKPVDGADGADGTDGVDGADGANSLTDLGISDGTVGQVLTTDGNGTFSFTDSAGGAGGGVAAEYTATGAITAGDFVALRQDGTVEPISYTTASNPTVNVSTASTAPSTSGLVGSGSIGDLATIVYDPVNSKFVQANVWSPNTGDNALVVSYGTLNSSNVIVWDEWTIVSANLIDIDNIERIALDIDPQSGWCVVAADCISYSAGGNGGLYYVEFIHYNGGGQSIALTNGDGFFQFGNGASSARIKLAITHCPWAYNPYTGSATTINGQFLVSGLITTSPNYNRGLFGYIYRDSSNVLQNSLAESLTSLADLSLVASPTTAYLIADSYGIETVRDTTNERVLIRSTYSTGGNVVNAMNMKIGYCDVSSTSQPVVSLATITDGTTADFFPYYVGSSTRYTTYQDEWEIASIAWDDTDEILYIVSNEPDTNGNSVRVRSFSVSGSTATAVTSRTLFVRPSQGYSILQDEAQLCKLVFDDSSGEKRLWVFYEYLYTSTSYGNYPLRIISRYYIVDSNGGFGAVPVNNFDLNLVNAPDSTNHLVGLDLAFYSTTAFASINPTQTKTFDAYYAITTNANDWIGIASEDIANAASGNIQLSGSVSSNQTSLVDGTEYYLNHDGTLVTSSTINTTSTPVGKAIGTTNFHIIGKSYERFGGSRDVDFSTNSPLTTSGLVLTSDGSGGFNFQTSPTPDLADLADVDSTTNTPLSTSGLVLTSDGTGGFDFQSSSSSFIGWTGTDSIIQYNGLYTGVFTESTFSSGVNVIGSGNNIQILTAGKYNVFLTGEIYKSTTSTSYFGYTRVKHVKTGGTSYYTSAYAGQYATHSFRAQVALNLTLDCAVNDQIYFETYANSSTYIRFYKVVAGLFLIGT